MKYQQKEYENSAKLTHYASGNGAISFVYNKMDHSGRRLAIGLPVTIDDARDYVIENIPKKWIEEGCKLIDNYGTPLFAKEWSVLGDTIVDPFNGDIIERKHGNYFISHDGAYFELKNISMLSSIKFYLENMELF